MAPTRKEYDLLKKAKEYCDNHDKSTEYMLQYMQDVANVDEDTVLEFLKPYFKQTPMRTKEEINQQIEGLKLLKTTTPQFSKFGDKNWEKYDAQIEILEDTKEPDDFWEDETAEEFQDGDNDIYWAAQSAYEWLHGDNEEPPYNPENN